ncbi:MAG: T3SS effector HopA1 family protein [Planctomycetota bacterium]
MFLTETQLIPYLLDRGLIGRSDVVVNGVSVYSFSGGSDRDEEILRLDVGGREVIRAQPKSSSGVPEEKTAKKQWKLSHEDESLGLLVFVRKGFVAAEPEVGSLEEDGARAHDQLMSNLLALIDFSSKELSLGSFRVRDRSCLSKPVRRAALLDELTAFLYSRAYCRPFGAERQPRAKVDIEVRRQFASKLESAIDGRSRLDEGWRVETVGAQGELFVRKRDAFLVAWPGEYLTSFPAARLPRVGERVRIAMDKAIRSEEGWLFAQGMTAPDHYRDARMLRIYFDLSPEEAPDYLTGLTQTLNAYRIPFKVKVSLDPRRYDRSDSGVLYFPFRANSQLPQILDQVSAMQPGDVERHTPPFVWPYRRGIGIADGRGGGGGGSHGKQCCALLAEAILRTWAGKAKSVERAAMTTFAEANRDWRKPWRAFPERAEAWPWGNRS